MSDADRDTFGRVRSDGELVVACPECDSSDEIYHRAGNGNATTGNPADPYVCYDCGASFQEYRRREARDPGSESVPGDTLAGQLHAADPDAVGGGGPA